MHCFNHPDRAALGSCKACMKGLCADCAADLGHGLACRGVHEARVEQLEELITRNMRVQAAAGGARYVSAAFMAFVGVVMLATGLYTEHRLTAYASLMGISFIVFAVRIFLANRQAYAGKA